MSVELDPSVPRAWVLNLDAEHELEAPGSYAPTARLRAIVADRAELLSGALVGSDDVVLREDAPPDPRARGRPGLAWCMTARARATLEAAGAIPVESPGVDVLRRVNARVFARDVRSRLLERGAHGAFAKDVAHSLEDALRLVARPAPGGWLVRRPFGAAGRGRRRLFAGWPDEAELAWLVASLRLGPLVIEPWVGVTREFTRSGLVRIDGTVVVAGPGLQSTRDGAWTSTRVARTDDVGRADDEVLEAACFRAGEALAQAGFFGPFGVDAFRYRDGAREVLNPLSEINARMTMDWWMTMGTSSQSRKDLSGAKRG